MKGNVVAVATDNGIYSADLSSQSVSTLSSLTLSAGALSPTFSSATKSYTASVPDATTSITVTPTVTDATASVQVNGMTVASESASASIPLVFGTNTLTVRVTAQDGSTTSTYTVTVYKYANSDSIAPIVINPIDFGLSASSFSDRVAISGDVVAVNQRINSGEVHVFQINSNSSITKLNTITAPDAVYDGPNFGRSLGVVGDVVYAGCHTTFRSGAHDGTAYLFNNATNANPNLVQKWTEFPSQWAGYFGMEGRMVGDTLVVSQGANPEWGSRGGAFFYRVNHDGSRTSVFSFMDQSTDHYGGGIALSASKCAVIWSPRASPSDCQIRTFDLQRDGSNNLVSVTENAVISAGAAAAGSSSIACDSDLVAMGEALGDKVRIWRITAGTATLIGTLTSPDQDSGGSFGEAVCLKDGVLIVGSPTVAGVSNAKGCAYIYRIPSSGPPVLIRRVQPSAPAIGSGEYFGSPIAWDGDRILFGSSGEGVRTGSGPVYVYPASVLIENGSATLSALALSSGNLSPAFSPLTTSYTASVPNTTSSITVTPTVTDTTATIKVNGTAVASGTASESIALAVGTNTITTVVTAQDGTSASTYTVSVFREYETQTLSFGALPAATYGDSPISLSATSSSGLAVSYASSDPAVATISGNLLSITGAGSVTITASQPGDGNFSAAADVPRTLVVNKASQTITFGALVDRTYGDNAFTLSASASSGLPTSYASSDTSVATVSGETVTLHTAGTTTITAFQAGDANYNAASVVGRSLVVAKANATVTLGNLAQTYDGSAKPVSTTTDPAGLPVTLTYNGSATTPTDAGSYAVVATVSSPNYTAGSAAGTFVIDKGVAAVGLSGLSATYDGTSKPVSVATVPAGLAFSVTYAGQTQVPSSAGTYAVAVTVNDANYTGTTTGNLLIAKSNQTITFAPIPNQTLDQTTVTLAATASSGLSPVFSVVSGPAAISGSTLSISGLGSIVVEASQAGDNNWNAAAPARRTFHVFSGTFAQDFVWAKGFGGSNSDMSYGIANDSLGNSLVAADFTGTVAFGGGNIISSGSSDLALLKVAADGNVLSATRFGGVNADYARAVAVDAANNAILAGEFMTSTSIGGVTHTSAGSKDISLLKVNSTGTLLWSKRFGGTLSDSIYGLATDADGNILLAGDFSGSITFGATTLTSSGNRDGFVAKLDPSGTPLWALKVGGTGNDTAFAVTVSPSGQILVGGSFSLVSTFGTLSRTSAGGTDGFAMAVSPAGIVQWATRFGGSANDSARAVTVDVTGAACFAGNFAGTDATFGMEILASEGADDVFVTRLNASDGSILNVKQCGGAGADAGLGLAADPFGSLYLSGSYSGTAYFDGHTLITPQGPDAFVAKLSVDGNFLWALAGGGVANDSATSIAVDRAGHVAVAGLFAQSAQIGSHEVTAGGLVDLFVARINGPVPSFVTTLGSVMAGIGDTFSISAPAVGADPLAYQWFKGTVPLAGQTSSTLEIPTATIGDQGSYHVVATNFYGSTQLPPVTVTVRVPDRVISIDAPVASQENRTLEVPVYLDSDGDVTGLTVVLPYDRDLLRNPSFLLGPHLVAGNSSVLVDTNAGTIRVVGSAFPSTIPVGRQLVGTFRFTTRSVPDNGIAVFSPTLSSISDQFGAALGGYTKLVGDQTPIAQRDIPGDANNNGRLDVSDAAELIRLYANPSLIRTWDHYLNDLNQDTILTEGDATRVLRVVANLDETPSFPEAIAPMMAPMMMAMASPSSLSTVSSSSLKGASVKMTSSMSMNSFSLAPAAARLVLTRLTGSNANKVLAQVYLDNVPAGQAGVSFRVDYPASVLRVAGASSLIIPSGGLPTGVAPTWNVSPGNDYAAQTGSLTLAAAWDSSWTFANGQAVANIVFEVNPAATGQVHFPLTLAATEVAPYNADGPSTPLAVPGQTVTFSRTYADWALATLGNAAAGSNADSDGDGFSNGLEFASSTNPNDPNSRLQTTSAAMTASGFKLRWFAAYGVSYKVRWSADLTNWTDLTTPYTGTGAETEVTDPAPPAGGRFYRVEVLGGS
jgi:hypothetical protein